MDVVLLFRLMANGTSFPCALLPPSVLEGATYLSKIKCGIILQASTAPKRALVLLVAFNII